MVFFHLLNDVSLCNAVRLLQVQPIHLFGDVLGNSFFAERCRSAPVARTQHTALTGRSEAYIFPSLVPHVTLKASIAAEVLSGSAFDTIANSHVVI